MSKRKCYTCSEAEVGEDSRTGLCNRCNGWWRYHLRQRPAQLAAYLQRVYLANGRCGVFTAARGKRRVM